MLLMKTMKEVIGILMIKIINNNSYKKHWIENNWTELTGHLANIHSKPYKIDKEILYVSVDSSVWNYNLFINKLYLIKKINNKFGNIIVKDVKYQVGEINNSCVEKNSNVKLIYENEEINDVRVNIDLFEKKIIDCLRKK